jgi:hypothetical protein
MLPPDFAEAIEAMRQEDWANWDQQMPRDHYEALLRVALVKLSASPPPAPQREPLTIAKIDAIWKENYPVLHKDAGTFEHCRRVARAIEAAHGIKEGS